jgi:hypothetical protein
LAPGMQYYVQKNGCCNWTNDRHRRIVVRRSKASLLSIGTVSKCPQGRYWLDIRIALGREVPFGRRGTAAAMDCQYLALIVDGFWGEVGGFRPIDGHQVRRVEG